jgi:hypothetical protein
MVRMQEQIRQGFEFWQWPRSGERWKEEDPQDEVIISPPPYEDGPDRRSDIRSSDDDPFRNIFGQ